MNWIIIPIPPDTFVHFLFSIFERCFSDSDHGGIGMLAYSPFALGSTNRIIAFYLLIDEHKCIHKVRIEPCRILVNDCWPFCTKRQNTFKSLKVIIHLLIHDLPATQLNCKLWLIQISANSHSKSNSQTLWPVSLSFNPVNLLLFS